MGLEPGEPYADPLHGWPFMAGRGLVKRGVLLRGWTLMVDEFWPV